MSTLRRSVWIRWLPPIERVAVPRHHPDRQVGARGREPGRDRRRTAVDRVHPVRLYVVRSARRSRCGHEHEILAHPELRQERLDAGQDRVVAAARAPAHLLVGLEVLRGQLDEAVAGAHADPSIARMACSSSAALSGRPRTFEYETASTRNCPAGAEPAGRGSSRGRAPSDSGAAPRPCSPGTGSGGGSARARDRDAALPDAAHGRPDQAVGRSPADDEQVRVPARVVDVELGDVGGDPCHLLRAQTIASWLSGS